MNENEMWVASKLLSDDFQKTHEAADFNSSLLINLCNSLDDLLLLKPSHISEASEKCLSGGNEKLEAFQFWDMPYRSVEGSS